MKKIVTQELQIAKTHIWGTLFMPSILCCFFIYYTFISSSPQGKEDIWWTLPVILSLILWGVIYVWNSLRFRVILREDSIQVKSLFSNKKIRVENLGNYKLDQYGLNIYLKNYTESPKIIISVTLDNVHLLQAWLQKHSRNPEVEAEIATYEEALKEFNESDLYGKNHLEKEENLSTVYKIAQWLNRISWLVFIWVGFGSLSPWNVPFMNLGIGITILIPILLVYFSIRYKDFFNIKIDQKKANPFPNVSFVLFTPSLALFIYWILQGEHISDTLEIWQYSFLVNALIMVPILYSARDISFKKIKDYIPASVIFLCLLGYSYGSIAYLNVYYDKSEVSVFSVKVLDKRTGKEAKDSDHITLTPWNNSKNPYEIEVSQHLFDKVKKGDNVLVHAKEGYLGIQYYRLAPQ